MTKESIRHYERLRFTATLTFVSGFLDGFTVVTQKGHFVGLQTGNLISLMIELAKGHFHLAGTFLLPILMFMLGQVASYFLKTWAQKKRLHWHRLSALLIFLIVTATAISAPYVNPDWTISALSFSMAMQLDAFQRVRGQSYANIMMTGNLRKFAQAIMHALVTKNHESLSQGLHIFLVLTAFCLGTLIAAGLAQFLGEYTLYPVLVPLATITYYLLSERTSR